MKATRKTIVTAVLTASMAVSAIPFSASAEEILVDNFAWDVIYNHEKYEEKFKGTTFDDAVREICGGEYMFYTGNPLTAWYPSYQHPVSGFCIDETGTTHMMSGYFTEVMIKVKADTELPLDEIKAVAEENGYNLPTFEKTEMGYRMINADDRETADFVMEQIKACGNVLAIDNHYAIWDNTYSIGTAYIRGIYYNGDMTVEELAEEYPSLNLYTPETEDEMEECGLNNTYVIDYSTMTCNQIYEKSAFLPDVIGWEHIKYTSEQIDDIRKLMNSGLDFKFYSKREMPTQANIDVHFSSAASVPVLIDGLKGDANIDGEKNMADAVMIMQSVANPNKYGIKAVNGITAQGSQNGDMDGNGITNADALAIQKDLLKLN